MATYANNGGTLECTGTNITSADILLNLNSLGIGSGHFGQTGGNKDVYFFNAPIRIGNSGSSGSSSIWDCSDECIKINAASFEIYGTVQQGNIVDATSEAGGAFIVTGTVADSFRLFPNGIFRAYGSMVYAQNRIRVGDDAEFTVIDCDFEPEDGVSPGESGSNNYGARQIINYDRSRVHNTGAVGIKLYSFNGGSDAAVFSLSETKVEDCTYAFQLGGGANLSPVLKDVRIDSCVYHIIPNRADADVTFINPDFTLLRAAGYNASDVTRIAFRYRLNVIDSSLIGIENARVIITDENGDEQTNSLTDSNGNVSTLPTYDGDTVLFNATYAGITRTQRADTTRAIASYGYNLRVDSFTINADFVDNAALIVDTSITEATKATVDAYTEIETPEKFYDRAKAYLYDNYASEATTIVNRSGSIIDAGSYNVTIDATAGSVFAFDGSTITIKASTFTGNITTTGTFTLANSATVVGSVTDTGGTEFSTSIEITNLTSADIYIEDDLGAQFDYQTGVSGTYNNTVPFGSTGTWKVVINRAGYIASVNTFTADGNTKSYNGDLVQLTQPSGSPMYTGSSSGVLTVVPTADGSRMNVRIGNGTVTAQQVLDESEVALSTVAGMEYLGNGGGRIEFASLATGTFLFLKDNVRLIRDNAGDSSATVEAFVTSSDGIILDNTNGDVQFVTVTRAQQLIEYDHAIYIDAANGTNANVYPYGTEANPVNSWSNAKVLADFYGFRNIRFKGNLTLDADLEGYIVEAGGVLDTLNISNFSVQGSTFTRMNMMGTGTGLRACETVNLMNGITNLSGTFALCAFNEQFSIADNKSATFSRCISNLPGMTSPQMNLGANTQVAIRDYYGSIIVAGSTAGCNTTLDFTSGKAVLDNTNTGGTISVRGITRTAFTDNSAGATIDSVGVLENEVMRGTDGANTIAPDNAGIASNGSAIAALNDLSAADIKAQADQALADYSVDTLTNVKPSVSI